MAVGIIFLTDALAVESLWKAREDPVKGKGNLVREDRGDHEMK
jgi:hypothetical protein